MRYSYICECGAKKDCILPSSKYRFRPRCIKCRKKMERDIVAEQKDLTHCLNGNWPMEQTALAVRPSQIEAARKYYAARGVSVDFTKQGMPIALNPRHNKEIVAARGCVDYGGGYTSAQPGDSKKYERG